MGNSEKRGSEKGKKRLSEVLAAGDGAVSEAGRGKRLKILAYDYEVVKEESLYHRHDCVALHQPWTLEIKVDRYAPRKENEIMHEVVESLIWQMELEIEHRALTALTNGICAFLRDNPGFTARFLER